MSGTAHKTTNKVVIDMYQALQAFGQRSMNTRQGDISLGVLLKAVDPLAQPVINGRIEAAGDVMDDIGEGSDTRLQIAIQVAQSKYDAQEVEYELPKLTRLRRDDLPRSQKGSEGWRNGTSIGQLIFWLGPLYDWGDDKLPEDEDEKELAPNDSPASPDDEDE